MDSVTNVTTSNAVSTTSNTNIDPTSSPVMNGTKKARCTASRKSTVLVLDYAGELLFESAPIIVYLGALAHLLVKLISHFAVKPNQNNAYFDPTTGLACSI